jgi:hypothetical protein
MGTPNASHKMPKRARSDRTRDERVLADVNETYCLTLFNASISNATTSFGIGA